MKLTKELVAIVKLRSLPRQLSENRLPLKKRHVRSAILTNGLCLDPRKDSKMHGDVPSKTQIIKKIKYNNLLNLFYSNDLTQVPPVSSVARRFLEKAPIRCANYDHPILHII